MESLLRLSLHGESSVNGWVIDLYYNEDRPSRGWLFVALKGVSDEDLDELLTTFLEGDDDMFAFIQEWLQDIHQKKIKEGDKAEGVILWFSEGHVHAFPLGGVHVFQNSPRRKRCLTDPIYDFTHYLRWEALSPGEKGFKVSYAIYPITGEDSFDIVFKDNETTLKISVDAYEDVWQSGRGQKKRKRKKVSPRTMTRKYGHRASVWVALILIFLVGAWYIWYRRTLPIAEMPQGETSTTTQTSTNTATSTPGNTYIEPLALWNITKLSDIATLTYADYKLPISNVWDIASVRWDDVNSTYFVAFTSDVGSAVRIAFALHTKSGKMALLDKWYKTVTVSSPPIEGVNWKSPQTFVSLDFDGNKLVLKSTFVNASWGSFEDLSDAFLDKLKDMSIQADGYDTVIALLTDKEVYLYSGNVGGTFKSLRMPISLPDEYHGERIYLSPSGDVYVLAYRDIRGKKKYSLVLMRASDDYVPDNLVMEKTETLLDDLAATYIGAPYLWKDGVVAFPIAGAKDGIALINIVNWKATLIEGRGVIYPLTDNKVGVIFESFFSLWNLERRE